jgi:S1-C subfamily serine protease
MSKIKNSVDTTTPLVSFSEAIENVSNKVSQSIVSVRSQNRGIGSGIIWDSVGHIVTCSHVVGKIEKVEVGLGDDKKYFSAKVIGNDFYSDIAVLQIETNSSINNTLLPKPIEIGDSENLKAGQFVLALANPYGEYPSVTQGIITSERSSIQQGGGGRGWSWWSSWWTGVMDNIVITDARLNPGYSGGPLVDVEGKMIGLNAAYISSRGIAIRANKVKNIVDLLVKDGRVKTAYLGIVTNEISLSHEIATQIEPFQKEGLIVLSVEKDTAAKKAGLLVGDIIVKFDNEPITNIQDLRRQLLKQDVLGKSVKLTMIRGERKSEITVIPQEAA